MTKKADRWQITETAHYN